MYEIQHQTQQLWESEPSWNLIARSPTLDEALVGTGRILRAWPGQAPKKPSDYRIVEKTSKGKAVAIYDTDGVLTAIVVGKKSKPELVII